MTVIKETKQSIARFAKNKFLFEELVKRDFRQRYKRTTLGMAWSVLSPLLTLLILKVVFTQIFGRNTPHFTIYMFAGVIVMSFYKEATKKGMTSLLANSSIITKINLPKYMFILSRNVSAFVNFLLTIVLFLIFCIFDHITFGWHFLLLVIPIFCELVMNIGIGMILSVWNIFFRDTEYLYDVFLTLLNYVSAIFYTVDRFGDGLQKFFLLNPVYVIIKYFRMITIEGVIPSLQYHALMLGYAFFFLFAGLGMYKKYNHQFIYYI